MRVKAKGVIKHHPHYLSAGDIVAVPDDVGQYMHQHGWVDIVDEEGKVVSPATTGDVGAKTLAIDSAAHKASDTGAK